MAVDTIRVAKVQVLSRNFIYFSEPVLRDAIPCAARKWRSTKVGMIYVQNSYRDCINSLMEIWFVCFYVVALPVVLSWYYYYT